MRWTIAIWVGVLVLFAPTAVMSAADLKDGAIVELSGTLERTWAFGRPNYGANPEKDRIDPYLVLKLTHKVDALNTDDFRVDGADRVELIFSGRNSPVWSQAQKMVDEQIVVTVSGKLKVTFTVHWGHEPLMIYVNQLAATTKKLE